jgi:predicted PurR-regulated permease PerM
VAASENPRSLIRYGVLIAGAAVVLLWAAYFSRHVLLLIYVSGLIAIGFAPVVSIIERSPIVGSRHLPRWLAILSIYLMFFGALGGVGTLVVPPLIEQGQDLWDRAPALIDDAQDWLVDEGLINRRRTVKEAVEEVVERVPENADPVGTALGFAVGIVGGLFGLFTMLVLSFYMLVYADSIFDGFARFFPRPRRGEVGRIAREVTNRVSSWLVGQIIIMAIVGGLTAIGLWIIGVPYFFVLGLLAALGEIIPIVGPVVASIPAILIAWTESLQKALIVTAYYIVLQQIESQILLPKVMGARVHVSPVTVLIALLIGHALFGLPGAILAIPTAASVMVAVDRLRDGSA